MARAELANRRLQPLGHVSAKSLENIAFNVNDGSARRAKNAGVAVSGGTWASHVRCAFARTSDATQTKRGARRRYDNFCFPPFLRVPPEFEHRVRDQRFWRSRWCD